MLCFPSMVDKEAPLDDNTQIVLQAIVDFIETANNDNPLESVVIRVSDKTQFEAYVETFRSKIQQLNSKR